MFVNKYIQHKMTISGFNLTLIKQVYTKMLFINYLCILV